MSLLLTHASVYHTATKTFHPGHIFLQGDRIVAVSESETPEPAVYAAYDKQATPITTYDLGGRRVIPGLVDVHTHGRAGGDFASADAETMCRMSESYLSSGVTTLLPTLASAPLEDLHTAIHTIGEVAATEGARADHTAHFAGVHLEGRYLNVAKRGAHAPSLLAPLSAEELESLLADIHGARHVTAALELDQDGSFLQRALALGATVGLGHSSATYAQAMDAIRHGTTAMTHLFNAMLPLHHREGGAVCAGLLCPEISCELICDGFHIAPEMVALAARLKGDHLVLITDSMEATGCADGEYTIAGMPVTVKDGKARTHDGAIAGSTLSLLDAIKNLCDFAGTSLEDAIYAATMAPAVEIGLEAEIGSLEAGKRADLLVLSENASCQDLQCDQIMCGGVFYTAGANSSKNTYKNV